MPFAQGSRTQLSYVAETNFGVTPVTPSLTALPYTSHSIDVTKDRVQGNDILSDRMVRTDRHGNRQVGGEIVADFRKGDFDPFLEAAFMNTWSTNVLKVGVTPKFFSIEDASLDISQYRLFTGCTVNTLAFSIRPNQMVTSTFGILGKDMTISGTSVDAVKTAASTNQPFDAYSGALTLGNAGGALTSIATITGIDFTINNNMAATFVVGSASTPQIEYGNVSVEGTITAYFEDLNLYNRFLNETETAIQVVVDDPTGTNDYTFLFPRVKFNGGSVPVEGPTSRIMTIPFVAIYDTTENTTIKLTRTA